MSKSLYIKTSDTCNLNCDHCFTSGRYGGKVKWDAEQTYAWVCQFMAQYPDEDRFLLIFHGGEPLLADTDDLHWFLDQFEGDPRVLKTISTNLVYKLTPEKFRFLQRLDSIGTSWDVDTRFENDKQLTLWRRNLETLRQHDMTYHVFVSVNRSLLSMDIDDFLMTLHEISPQTVRLERLTSHGHAVRNRNIFPDNEEQDNWFLEVYKRYKKYKSQLSFSITTLEMIDNKIENNMIKVDTSCRNCEQNMATINADGTLGGCPNAAASRQHAHIEDPIAEFFYSPARLDDVTHELDFHPNCLSCDVFSICGGDCHQLAWQGDRCPGLKHLMRYVRDQHQHATTNEIPITLVG